MSTSRRASARSKDTESTDAAEDVGQDASKPANPDPVEVSTPATEDADQSVASKPEPDASAHATSERDDGKRERAESGTVYLNVSGGPLLYTAEGHHVDAHAWTPSVNLDRIGRAARDRGFLRPPSSL